MKQHFDEDRAELEAHFAERVQAYVELGETPEQAHLSAREKFGETEAVLRKLRWQGVLRSPLFGGLVCAAGYLLITALTKRFLADSTWLNAIYCFTYALYVLLYTWKGSKTKKCRSAH